MAYFLRINDAPNLRRKLLESSKDLIHILKGYQRILNLRDAKRETADALRETLGELNGIMAAVEKYLPEKSLKELDKYLPKEKSAVVEKKEAKGKRGKKGAAKGAEPEAAPPASPKEPELTESERLEKALSNIESRLSRL